MKQILFLAIPTAPRLKVILPFKSTRYCTTAAQTALRDLFFTPALFRAIQLVICSLRVLTVFSYSGKLHPFPFFVNRQCFDCLVR